MDESVEMARSADGVTHAFEKLDRQDLSPRPKKANIYNKVVWGILFREVFPELRYGFTDEVRQQLRDQLQSALNP